MWRLFFVLFTIQICISSSSSTTSDYIHQKQFIKPGFGVVFQHVGDLLTMTDYTSYTHTWTYQLPFITGIDRFKTINCSGLPLAVLQTCMRFNNIIREVNNDAQEFLIQFKNKYDLLLQMIPLELNEPMGFSAGALSSSDVVEYLPSYIVGNAFASLTGSVKRSTFKKAVKHFSQLGKVVELEVISTLTYELDTSAVCVQLSEHIDNLRSWGSQANTHIDQLYDDMLRLQSKMQDFRRNIRHIESISLQIDRNFVSNVLPFMIRLNRMYTHLNNLYDMWSVGIRQLNKGYLSPFVASPKQIKSLLERVRQDVLQNSAFSQYNIISYKPEFYYELKNVAYARNFTQDGTQLLHITVQIPLYKQGNMLKAFRVKSYPVAVQASKHSSQNKDYTQIYGLPHFFAISPDTEKYIELSSAVFSSCKGIHDIKMCGTGVELTRKSNSMQTCAYALYTDNYDAILQHCDVRHESVDEYKPPSSAVQLQSGSGTYLMYNINSDNDDSWRYVCPNLQPKYVKSCQLCVVTLNCGCSLASNHYLLPVVYRRACDENPLPIEYKKITNTFAMYNFFNESMKREMLSYKHKLDKFIPHITIPPIKFSTISNFSKYVGRSTALNSKYEKILALQKRDMSIFRSKADKLLNITENMSDVIESKSMSITKPFKYITRKILGDSAWQIITFVFSLLFVNLIVCIFASSHFFPLLINHISVVLRQRKADHAYSLLLTHETEI